MIKHSQVKQPDTLNAGLYSQGLVDQGYGPKQLNKVDRKTVVADMTTPEQIKVKEKHFLLHL
jgi:hypothetical protein